jgi:hypothetical protein
VIPSHESWKATLVNRPPAIQAKTTISASISARILIQQRPGAITTIHLVELTNLTARLIYAWSKLCQRKPYSPPQHALPSPPNPHCDEIGCLLAFLSDFCPSTFLFSLAFKQVTRRPVTLVPSGCVTSSIFVFHGSLCSWSISGHIEISQINESFSFKVGALSLYFILFVHLSDWSLLSTLGIAPEPGPRGVLHLDKADLPPPPPDNT